MARTGSFGRQPRALPSLTATLLAIAREQENQRDQNIMEAWQKGGMFEGKKATDALVLAHWRHRLDGIDKQDPLYDTYKNAVTQYEYAIAESKMTAKYAQGQVDENAMSSFYMGWSRKIPTDSEFYRVLLRDAGQYMKAAKAKNEQAAKEAAEKQYVSKQNAIDTNEVQPGTFIDTIVTGLAQEGSRAGGTTSHNAILGQSPTTSNDPFGSSNLGSMGLGSVDEFAWLISTITPPVTKTQVVGPESMDAGTYTGVPTGKNAPQENVLFTDGMGKSWTGTEIVANLKKLDPSFTGKVTPEYISGLMRKSAKGYKKQAELARKTGHVSDASAYERAAMNANEAADQVAATHVYEKYALLKQREAEIMRDNSLLPKAKDAALAENRRKIGLLSKDPSIATDGHLQSQLNGEAGLVSGTQTLEEDLNGGKTAYPDLLPDPSKSVVDNMKSQVDQLADINEGVASGTKILTQGNYDSQGNFTPAAGATGWGAVTPEELAAVQAPGKPVVLKTPDGDGKGFTTVAYLPIVVDAYAVDPDTGKKLKVAPDTNPQFTTAIRGPVNGVMETRYWRENKGPDGKPDGSGYWTKEVPGGGSKDIKVTEDGKGIHLEIRAVPTDLGAAGPNGGAIPGTGWSVINRTTAVSTAPGGTTTALTHPGELVFNAGEAVYALDPTANAGFDPTTDSFSASVSFLLGSPEQNKSFTLLRSDSDFADLLKLDAATAAGATYDPQGSPVFANDAQKFEYQANIGMRNPNTAAEFIGKGKDVINWVLDNANKMQTDLRPAGAGPQAVFNAVKGAFDIVGSATKDLPLDGLRGQGGGKWKSLYEGVIPGTNALVPPKGSASTGPTISTGITLNVPKFEPVKLPGVNTSGQTYASTSPTNVPTNPANQPKPTNVPTPPPPSPGRPDPRVR